MFDLILSGFLEEYMFSGSPHLRALYYDIKSRSEGIKKGPVMELIKRAAETIRRLFHLSLLLRGKIVVFHLLDVRF